MRPCRSLYNLGIGGSVYRALKGVIEGISDKINTAPRTYKGVAVISSDSSGRIRNRHILSLKFSNAGIIGCSIKAPTSYIISEIDKPQ